MQQVEKPGEGGEAQWCEHCGKGGDEADGLVIPGVYLGKQVSEFWVQAMGDPLLSLPWKKRCWLYKHLAIVKSSLLFQNPGG